VIAIRLRPLLVILAAVCYPQESQAMGKDDPLLTMVMIDKLEFGLTDESIPQRLEMQAWAGYDLSKLWLKSDVEREGGNTDSADVEVLYGRAISPYWDVRVGWKHDFEPTPSRDWAAIGIYGLAPYFFEVDSTAYINSSGQVSLDLSVEYEVLFTQRLILSPEIEAVINGSDDSDTGSGSGVSSIEAGLRLRYEIRREFAPYIGVHWERSYGNTADFDRVKGEDIDDFYVVVGIRAWF